MTRFHIHRHCGLPILAASPGLLLPWLLNAQWAVAEICLDPVPNFLKLTDITPLSEAAGVATNSKKISASTRVPIAPSTRDMENGEIYKMEL
jgi:hypothetical protein